MLFRLIFVFFCFLIISCDLPDEADSDCNDINLGTAFVDECGRCVEGNTGFLENQDKDFCGECFGTNQCYEPRCNDELAINYFNDALNIDNNLCVYDLCTDYIPESTFYLCNESENDGLIYQIGDQLHCDDIENPLDICFPDDCANELSLSDLYGKVIWIEMTASW